MKLFEYQAKGVFAEQGITVPRGIVADSPEAARQAARDVGVPCMVKAQLLRGGRGKLGLVKRAATADEAARLAADIMASPYGVRKVLVEACAHIAQEVYLSISMEPVSAKAMVMLCPSGGVEIEELARTAPEKILKGYIALEEGVSGRMLDELLGTAGFSAPVEIQMRTLIERLYRTFRQYDAELAEINPVFVTPEETVVAGDGKLIIDDNSMFRQPGFEKTREHYASDMEFEAAKQGIPYIQFDGDISLMCAGAGLTTAVYDLINYEGGKVANYLEFGGPHYTKAETAMRICLENRSSVILIVTFGTIARADVIAEGVIKACEKLRPDRPLVTCIRGTNEEEAHAALKAAGLECLTDTEEAVRRAVAYAKEAKSQ